jgi:hypothetical protein
MRQENEPSVEEILESIKKVIARDNQELAAATRVNRENPALSAGSAEASDSAEEILDLSSDAMILPEGESGERPSLVNEGARTSMRESLAALAMLSEPGVPPQIVRSGETSLEGLVRDMLRPMLAQWLDTNLPLMVEKLVAAEIARIAGKKG